MFIQWFNCIDLCNYLHWTGQCCPRIYRGAFNQLWYHRTYCIQRNRFIGPASSVSGLQVLFSGERSWFSIDPTYLSNTPIVSSATFNGTTLAGLGFTTTGLIGTWSLTGTSESIQVIIGAPTSPGATVPGPLPLLGAGAAFGWSRRLRKRIVCPLSIPPQV